MYKVMVVDDSEVQLREIRCLKIWKQATDFQLTAEAGNGDRALRMLTEAPVDLVITDIGMPKVNGLQLLEKIRERKLAKTVVLMSEEAEFNYAREGMVLGAFDYFVKPIDEAEMKKLLSRVARRLAEKNAKQEQLRRLYEQVKENALFFYPELEIKILTDDIIAGNLRAVTLAHSLVRILGGALDGVKVGFILQRAIGQIIFQVEQKHPWIKSFVSLELVLRNDYIVLKNGEQLNEAFIGWVHRLAGVINKLSLGNQSNMIVRQVSSYVLQNIDAEISIKGLAEALFMHRSYLSDVIKQQTGWRLSEYITMVKLERAKKLIADGQLLGYQIAGQLGYRDVEYFSRIFKKYTGLLPSQYKEFWNESNVFQGKWLLQSICSTNGNTVK